jgi:hypothetical protein
VREAVQLLAESRLATPVYIYHANKQDEHVIVERRSLLDACSSIKGLQSFMAGQLGIVEGQEVCTYWSADSQPGGEQHELPDKLLEVVGSLWAELMGGLWWRSSHGWAKSPQSVVLAA